MLTRKRVNFHVLDQQIDTGDATGRLLFNMFGAIAQFETDIWAERQRDGIAKARQQGVHFGAKPKLTATQILELRQRRAQGQLIKTLMTDYQLSKVRVYKWKPNHKIHFF